MARSNCFLGFSFVLVVKAGIDGVAAGFDQELAHEAKHTAAASETKSQPERMGFICFC